MAKVLFFGVQDKTKTIYVKVNSLSTVVINGKRSYGVHEKLIDFLHDKGCKCYRVTPNKWEYNIESGLSYEIDTEHELNTFIKNNTKLKKHRTYAI